MVTTDADAVVGRLHHRGPVVLEILSRNAGIPLDAYVVSKMVKKPSVDGQELIRPVPSPIFQNMDGCLCSCETALLAWAPPCNPQPALSMM
jgi:putative SOS response-associated peptidase YedK